MQDIFNFVFNSFLDICNFAKIVNWPISNIISQYAPYIANNTIFVAISSIPIVSYILNFSFLGVFSITAIITILIFHLIHLVNIFQG